MNLVTILVAALAGMTIGALWYGPLFGRHWIKLIGMSQKDIEKMKKDPKVMAAMKRNYALAFLGQLVMAIVLAFLINRLEVPSVIQGAILGALLWLGLIATTQLNRVLWERKSWKLYWFDMAHYLLVLVVMGAILAW